MVYRCSILEGNEPITCLILITTINLIKLFIHILIQEAEGDFDEQTKDDWDVDFFVYFEENCVKTIRYADI